jgi:hypothetical protein
MTIFKARIIALLVPLLVVLAFSVAPAGAAQSTWWKLSTNSYPTVLKPGGVGVIVVQAVNRGYEAVDSPATMTVKLPPWLEATAIAGVNGTQHYEPGPIDGFGGENLSCPALPAAALTCTYTPAPGVYTLAGPVPPFGMLQVFVTVKVAPDAPASGFSEAAIEGGETPSVSERQALTTGYSIPFGIERNELELETEEGTPDTQAGSHPFQVTSTIDFNSKRDSESTSLQGLLPLGPEMVKAVNVKLPPGLVGNANLIPQCTEAQFDTIKGDATDLCPADTQIGVALVTYTEPKITAFQTEPVPIFNLPPTPGEPARFGWVVEGVPVSLDTAVRSGSDYGVTVSSSNISQAVALLKAEVTLWGVPGAAQHAISRGWGCVAGGVWVIISGSPELAEVCDTQEGSPQAFLTLPTSCGEPLQSSVEADSWERPGAFTKPLVAAATNSSGAPLTLTGCNRLPFEPSVEVTPDGTAASSPTGLTVDVHNPQEATLSAKGLGEADPRTITLALPEGVALNPSGGDGLGACSEGLVGFTGLSEAINPGSQTATFTPRLPGSFAAKSAVEGHEAPAGEGTLEQGVNFCADASRIGTVEISSPLLPPKQRLTGSVYLATQNANPFGSLVAIYIVAEDPVSGVLAKLAGEVHLSATGQIVTTLQNNPQVPFEDAEIHFFGGERAPLATPSHCGTYTSTASMTAWTGATATPSSTFAITSGPNGSACPGASLPFSPSLTSGTTNINAGAFSPLTTTIGREDGQQNLASVTLHYPAGLSGLLSGVKLCPEAQANAGTCGPESLVGETVVSAGVGSDPVSVTGGKVYLTEKYNGAPFGLSIVNPVKAGPFDLEHDTSQGGRESNDDPACDCIVVRAKIAVDPTTAALTVTTNSESEGYAIPHLIDGIPVQIKKVNVLINRPGFTFNPTNCSKMEVTGSIASDEGANAQVTPVPFEATNCAVLKFAPKFTVSTSGKTSKSKGASLTATLSEPKAPFGSQANITRVKVDLPKQLPSRLTTLQKACPAKTFEEGFEQCLKLAPASKIGTAKVTTPLLPVPLEGPAIFVSHGGEAFPSLTMVLQGYGVTIDLVGTTFISKKGITSTTFKTVPDVPFNAFTLTLPEGKFSALAANGKLCKSKLAMPTEFLAQNGAKINESTKVGVTGCPKVKKAAKKKHKKNTKGRK